jgi:Tfp pilus assembly protein PilF
MIEPDSNVESLCKYRAKVLIEDGLDEVYAGNYETALEHFQESLDTDETAEAYTYCGWMHNTLGDSDVALSQWYRAIEVDPEFGNPYNDIGSSLLQKGRLNEAVRWFYKALDAENYDTRQFPHVNLGKLYLAKKLYKKSLYHFHQALEIDPGNRQLEFMILDLEEKLS